MKEYKRHRLNYLSEKSELELTSLREKIKDRGYNVNLPIRLYEGQILDGWHRYNLCKELGITPEYEDMGSMTDEEAIFYVDANNMNRQENGFQEYLSASNRHMALKEKGKKNLAVRSNLPLLDSNKGKTPHNTEAEMAEILAVKQHIIKDYDYILKYGTVQDRHDMVNGAKRTGVVKRIKNKIKAEAVITEKEKEKEMSSNDKEPKALAKVRENIIKVRELIDGNKDITLKEIGGILGISKTNAGSCRKLVLNTPLDVQDAVCNGELKMRNVLGNLDKYRIVEPALPKHEQVAYDSFCDGNLIAVKLSTASTLFMDKVRVVVDGDSGYIFFKRKIMSSQKKINPIINNNKVKKEV